MAQTIRGTTSGLDTNMNLNWSLPLITVHCTTTTIWQAHPGAVARPLAKPTLWVSGSIGSCCERTREAMWPFRCHCALPKFFMPSNSPSSHSHISWLKYFTGVWSSTKLLGLISDTVKVESRTKLGANEMLLFAWINDFAWNTLPSATLEKQTMHSQ